jgi:Leucine-rich repeat (LRR) protein
LSPLATLPQDVFFTLVNTYLSVKQRGSLRASCKDLRQYVDDVITTVTICINVDDLQSLLQRMPSLIGVSVTSESILTTSALQAFMLAAGQSLQNRLHQFRLESHSDGTSSTPLILSPLAGCPHLNIVEIMSHAGPIDLTGLGSLSALQSLSLGTIEQSMRTDYEMSIHDLSPLSKCMSLHYLSLIDGKKLHDISPLAVCTGLRHLQLEGCDKLRTITALATCQLLEHVDLNLRCIDDYVDCIRDISPLASCPLLKHLDLHGLYELVDISPISACKKLQYLDLGLCSPTDIAPLASCTGLQYLVLNVCSELLTISPLAMCTQLVRVYLSKCPLITDISPLSSCPLLEDLALDGLLLLVDISPLSACKQLRYLDLGECAAITNLSPLTTSTKLRNVCLRGIPPHIQAQRSTWPWYDDKDKTFHVYLG